MIRKVIIVAASVATAFGIGPLAAPAHADVDDVDGYIAVLNHEGIDPSNRAAVVHMGREVCESFDHGITLNPILSAISTGGGYTNDEAQWIVAAAVTKLCPNHRGDVH
jgi:Protein of unknown function (DUF732)